MIRSYILTAALLVATPLAAAAQFTAVITPPRKEQAVASTPQSVERSDSVQRAQLTDMKVWVDSAAAALTSRTITPRDSVTPVEAIKPTPVPAPATRERIESSRSTRLPDTASPLPFVALLGAGMVGAGLFMLRKNRG